ncbi:low temperature requirement protein A [Haladaptatus sp. CMAA 1911]|uniref:low temperature requirement protein A n=1 Tax=unclassified Haladaptatus TaxID=2622732 RepID=UPI003753E972
MRRNRSVRLHTETGEERHATWLELFFDLVFVLAVAQLGRLLHDNLSPQGFLLLVALFFPVWWAWVGFTYYADQFGTDDPIFRSVIVVAMFGVIAFATTVHDVLAGGTVAFAAAYLSLRLLVVGLYVQTWLVTSDLRELCRPWIAGFALGATVWVASLFVPPPTRYLLWVLGLGIEMATPIVSNLDSNAPIQVSHLPERFGLFTILVLGEVILAVGAGTIDIDWEFRGSIVAASGFVVAVCIYSLYFRNFDWTATTQGISGDRRTLAREFIYGYNHPLVFAGIVATGVGVQGAIESTASGHPFSVGGRFAFVGGLMLYLFAITASQWAAPRSISVRVLSIRLVAVGLLGLLSLVDDLALVTVTLAAGVLVGLVAFEEVDSRFDRSASEVSRAS